MLPSSNISLGTQHGLSYGLVGSERAKALTALGRNASQQLFSAA
jgi:hypothetical protein